MLRYDFAVPKGFLWLIKGYRFVGFKFLLEQYSFKFSTQVVKNFSLWIIFYFILLNI